MTTKHIVLITALCVLPLLLNAQLISGTFTHGGLNRTYQIYLPANIQPNAPLVFNMHGHTGNINQQITWTGMNVLADDFGFAVCYPLGSLSNAGNTHWNSGFNISTVDDVGFLTALAAYLQTTYQLNPAETFACGFSNGGYMSYHLACHAASTFRAIASVGGLMSAGTFNTCNPSNPVPVYHIHGASDNLVPVTGYPDYNDGWGAGTPVATGINYWKGVNNCFSGTSDTYTMVGGTVVNRERYNCANPVWYDEIQGEGHYWPNSANAQTDFPATEKIWKFFNQFTSGPTIDTNFEGGNACLLGTGANNYIKISSEYKSNDTRNIVYYCKILGLDITQNLQLEADTEFTGNYTFYSYDNVTWYRSNPKVGDIFTIPLQSSEIYVAHFPPYLYTRISTYLDSLQSVQQGFYEISELTISEGGRPVEIVRITDDCVADTDKKLMWVLGRMHGFEHPANYSTEGMLRFFVSNDPKAIRLRREAIIYIVPMMDVDAAFNGATGKDQNPVDFNRDWISPTYNSHWNATVAAKNLLASTAAANELSLFVDMHSVAPTGTGNFHFIYNTPVQVVFGQNFIDHTNTNGGENYTSTLFNAFNPAISQDYVLQYHSTPSLLSITPEADFNFTLSGTFWTQNSLITQGKAFGKACSDYINATDFTHQIAIDNTNASAVTSTGTWTNSTFIPGYYGSNYQFAAANSNATYTFTLANIPAGLYEASMFYSSDANRATNVNTTLTYAGGTRNHTINQQMFGNQWRRLDTLTLAANSTVAFTIDANGTDGFVVADAFRLRPVQCTTCSTVSLDINFDGFPAQTSWDITDANGNTVAASGDYSSVGGNSNLTENTCLSDGCYTLTFYDAINNGMCPFQSNAVSSGTFITPGTLVSQGSVVATLGSVVSPGLCGNYTLTDADDTVLASGGGGFGNQQIRTFCLSGGVGNFIQSNNFYNNKNIFKNLNIKIFPNIVKNKLTIEYALDQAADARLYIFDMNGCIVRHYSPANDVSILNLHVGELPAGFYFVQLVAGQKTIAKKFVKQ